MNSDIEEFLEFSKEHSSMDYGDPSSVKAGNRAAHSMRVIVTRLIESGRTEELLELLDNTIAGPWVAFTVAMLPNVTSEQKLRCLELIRRIASGDSIESVGAEMWLRDQGYDHS